MNLKAATASIFLLLAGCEDGPNDVVCTLIVEPAIIVEVSDRDTGSFFADGALAIVRDGSYVDTLSAYETGRSLAGA